MQKKRMKDLMFDYLCFSMAHEIFSHFLMNSHFHACSVKQQVECRLFVHFYSSFFPHMSCLGIWRPTVQITWLSKCAWTVFLYKKIINISTYSTNIIAWLTSLMSDFIWLTWSFYSDLHVYLKTISRFCECLHF